MLPNCLARPLALPHFAAVQLSQCQSGNPSMPFRGISSMQQALIVAAIAAAVTAFGWLVNYALSTRAERHRQALAARLLHVERQLERLYGPLVFLIHEGRASISDLLGTLGRSYIFKDQHNISDEDLGLWLFWVDNDLMPRNAAIEALLSTQSHLIVGNNMPSSYLAFIQHYNAWRISHLRWKKEQVGYSWHSKNNWPHSFEPDVIEVFELLKREQAALLGAVGQRESRSTKARLSEQKT
jgi:hypothetical protein